MKRGVIIALIHFAIGLAFGFGMGRVAPINTQPQPSLNVKHPTTQITQQDQQQVQEQPTTKRFTVWATREGLIGGTTASGRIIKPDSIFVALPSRSALNRTIIILYKGRAIEAPVWDVGPHNTIDNYWNKDGVPAAQRGERLGRMAQYGKPKNAAGIDLSDALWDQFEIPRRRGIVKVTWWWK